MIERPGQKTLAVEIKSAKKVKEDILTRLRGLVHDLDVDTIVLAKVKQKKVYGDISVMPWQQGL